MHVLVSEYDHASHFLVNQILESFARSISIFFAINYNFTLILVYT